MTFERLEPIVHDLARHYGALRAVANRRALERSALWSEIRGEVERVVSAVERGHAAPTARRPLRFAAWNVRRGARFEAIVDALRGDAMLARADALLLTEVDCGLGRSQNRNVARELAAALGMSYAFAPSYLTLEDDWGENGAGLANTTALAGTAILSRAAIRWAENVELPELRDKFSSSERRLGRKRALLVELGAPSGSMLVAACHLDSNASPGQRARQLAALLDRVDARAAAIAPGQAESVPAVLGGDFNSSTHDLSSPLAAIRDAFAKLLGAGVRRTVDGYMTPEQLGERPLFDLLASRGFRVDGFNDRSQPTYHYDFRDPYALEKLRRVGGRLLVAAIQRLLRPWDGCLPARLDWLAGRGVRSLSAAVVRGCREGEGAPSDHAPVICDADP